MFLDGKLDAENYRNNFFVSENAMTHIVLFFDKILLIFFDLSKSNLSKLHHVFL